MTKPLETVYFSSIDWGYTWQRPQQLASRLALQGKLLFINPFGLRSVVWGDWKRVLQRLIFRAPTNRSKSLPSSLMVYSPRLYGPKPGEDWSDRLNGWLLQNRIRRWLARNDIRSPIYWVGVPSRAILHSLNQLPPGRIVYDCIDDFSQFHPGNLWIRQTETELIARANLVFATSHELENRIRHINSRTFLLPNAVDAAHFVATEKSLVSPRLSGITPPILGYVGEIAGWFDFDLLYDLAADHPEWQIVLIGQVQIAIPARVLECSNIHWLGRKPYAELPNLIRQFDVCLLPFLTNRLTAAVNPVKVYEYLAMGKPVVSTRLDEVMLLGDLVYTAECGEFAYAVQHAMTTETDAKKEKRRQFAMNNTWDVRLETIVCLLRDGMP